ncbi:hypothetical protein CWI38_0419p0020 [Hamiltosporidium tvaerminnensis]|uniref:Uncharacterized protein n=1 Tax=Hamiltosporidium tvaerminnensis TaxID=1176355 RepID=A0A4Q9M092_9MICR|nr:hypothetical protein CWI38_0419p0020 [Hamiltosporidium tvaerminnensis]
MIFSYKKIDFEINLKPKNTIFNYKNTTNIQKKYIKKKMNLAINKNSKYIKSNKINSSLYIPRLISFSTNQIYKYVTKTIKEHKRFKKLQDKKPFNVKKQYFLIENLQKKKCYFPKLEINYMKSINQYFIKTVKHSFLKFKINFYIKIQRKIQSQFYRNISFIKLHFDILEPKCMNANICENINIQRIISHYEDNIDDNCIYNEYITDSKCNYQNRFIKKFISENSLNINHKSNIKYNRIIKTESENKYKIRKNISDRNYSIEINIFNSKGYEKFMMYIKKEYEIIDVNIENDMIILINKRVALCKKYLNLYEKEVIIDKDIEISFIENIIDLYPSIKID